MIREVAWPALRTHRFARVLGRSAYREWLGGVDVVNFQSFSAYIADGVGCTTHSFGVNLGVWLRECYGAEGVRRAKAGWAAPHEWTCDLRGHLRKGLWQPWFKPFALGSPTRKAQERIDVWFVLPNGENIREVSRTRSSKSSSAGSHGSKRCMTWTPCMSNCRRMSTRVPQGDPSNLSNTFTATESDS